MTFQDLQLNPTILRAIDEQGYTTPTPIQGEAIPVALTGRDILGCAQTGTGKTAAFSIPIIQLLENRAARENSTRRRPIKTLILTPTRELALQIEENFALYGKYSGIRSCVIFGGVGQKPQTDALNRGVDVLIATPGRLHDLINQGFIKLGSLEFFVLDEADRMLDMGFIADIRRLLPMLPKERQTLFFSATMPTEIARLASSILSNPQRIEVTPANSTVEIIEQSLYHVDKDQKTSLLRDLITESNKDSVLVFTRTKHGADKVAKQLTKWGIPSEAIHGNKSQNARQRALKSFKDRTIRVLIATDIAARGIDIDSLSHVVNYDLPDVPETYVHRIGRTGRAGLGGTAIAFCEPEHAINLRDIEKLIGFRIPVVENHSYKSLETVTSIVAKTQSPEPKIDARGGKKSGQSNNRSRDFRRREPRTKQ